MSGHGYRLRLQALLMLLLAGGVARGEESSNPFLPNARVLFAGCTPSEDGTSGRSYECPRQQANISYWGGLIARQSDAELLELALKATLLNFSGPVTQRRGTLKFASHSQPAYHLLVREQEGEEAVEEGYLTVDRTSKGYIRIYNCFANAGARAELTKCRRMLEYFANQGPPEPVDLELASHSFSGTRAIMEKSLKIPPECRVMGMTDGGVIQCPTGMLTWSVFEQGTEPARLLQMMIETTREKVKTELTERSVPCSVAQHPAMCVQLYRETPKGRLLMYIAIAQVEQYSVGLSCLFVGKDEALPAVCNGPLRLETSP